MTTKMCFLLKKGNENLNDEEFKLEATKLELVYSSESFNAMLEDTEFKRIVSDKYEIRYFDVNN